MGQDFKDGLTVSLSLCDWVPLQHQVLQVLESNLNGVVMTDNPRGRRGGKSKGGPQRGTQLETKGRMKIGERWVKMLVPCCLFSCCWLDGRREAHTSASHSLFSLLLTLTLFSHFSLPFRRPVNYDSSSAHFLLLCSCLPVVPEPRLQQCCWHSDPGVLDSASRPRPMHRIQSSGCYPPSAATFCFFFRIKRRRVRVSYKCNNCAHRWATAR